MVQCIEYRTAAFNKLIIAIIMLYCYAHLKDHVIQMKKPKPTDINIIDIYSLIRY